MVILWIDQDMDSANKITDEELLLSYYQGNEEAFVSLWDSLGDDLYNISVKLICDLKLAEDLCQFAWEEIISNQSKYKEMLLDKRLKLRAYMITMIRNRHIDTIRAKRTDDDLNTDDSIADNVTATPPEDAMIQEKLFIIEKCLQKMALIYREIFILIKIEGLSLKEISDLLEIKLETAKTRRRASYKQMDECVEVNYVNK